MSGELVPEPGFPGCSLLAYFVKWPQWHESEAFRKRKIDRLGFLLEQSQQGGVFAKERRVWFSVK